MSKTKNLIENNESIDYILAPRHSATQSLLPSP